MRAYDHERKPGAIAAWKSLNAIVAKDIADGVGHITAPTKRLKMNPAKIVIGWFARRRMRGELVKFEQRRKAQ